MEPLGAAGTTLPTVGMQNSYLGIGQKNRRSGSKFVVSSQVVLYRANQLASRVFWRGETQQMGEDSDVCLIEGIPEHGDHNFLRGGFHDICASYVSIPPKSEDVGVCLPPLAAWLRS